MEIDESKFRKHKYYRGHKVDGQLFFGGREKYNKSKIFMVPVNKRDAKTLLPIITKWIAMGSIIHSNCWKAYNELAKMGYQHVTVNHSKQFLNPETAAQTVLKVIGGMLNFPCPHMEFIRDSMQHIWQNSYGCENIMMRINPLK